MLFRSIKKKIIFRAFNTFKGLSHRNEIFYKKGEIIFINDSKATTFNSAQHTLRNNKNIFWIVGGVPKLGDIFNLRSLSKNIKKAYIIGKKINYFKNQIGKAVKYKSSFNLENAVQDIFKDLVFFKKKQAIVLLSPASASYDQFKDFTERGNQFKKLILKYAKKF